MYLSKQFCSDIYITFLPKIIYLYIINIIMVFCYLAIK